MALTINSFDVRCDHVSRGKACDDHDMMVFPDDLENEGWLIVTDAADEAHMVGAKTYCPKHARFHYKDLGKR